MSRSGDPERAGERSRLQKGRRLLQALTVLAGSSLVIACGPGQIPIDALPTVAPATTPTAEPTSISFARRAATPAVFGTLPPNADVEVVPSGSEGRRFLLDGEAYHAAVDAARAGEKPPGDVHQEARRLLLLRTRYIRNTQSIDPEVTMDVVDTHRVNTMDATDLGLMLAITEAMLLNMDQHDKSQLNFPIRETAENILQLRGKIKFAESADLIVPAAELSLLAPVLEITEKAGKPYPKEFKYVGEDEAIGYDAKAETLSFSEGKLLYSMGLYYATEAPDLYGEFERDTKVAEARAGVTLDELGDRRYASVFLRARRAVLPGVDDFAVTYEAFVTRRQEMEDQIRFNFHEGKIQAAEILQTKLNVFDRWWGPGIRTLEKAKPTAPIMLDLVPGDKLEVYDPAFYPQNGIITKDVLKPGPNPNRPAVQDGQEVTLVDEHSQLIIDPSKAQAPEFLLVEFKAGQTGYVPKKYLKRAS